MKTTTTSLLRPLLCAATAAASFIHWGHHEHDVVRIHKGWGPFDGVAGTPHGYHSLCEAEASFKAQQYKKSELYVRPPMGLRPWAETLEAFIRDREYPGHWKGDDQEGHGGAARDYLVMEYTDVPKAVREWIDHHHGKGLGEHNKWFFAVLEKPKGDETITGTVKPQPTPAEGDGVGAQDLRTVPDKDKILFFAAGAIYEMLPLWVAEGSKCKAELMDLARHHPYPVDKGVVAWPVEHTSPDPKSGVKDVTFSIKAQVVVETDEVRERREHYDKMSRNVRRQQRKQDKESRARGMDDDSITHEEL